MVSRISDEPRRAKEFFEFLGESESFFVECDGFVFVEDVVLFDFSRSVQVFLEPALGDAFFSRHDGREVRRIYNSCWGGGECGDNCVREFDGIG